jgi:small subunit ribosomal protein S9
MADEPQPENTTEPEQTLADEPTAIDEAAAEESATRPIAGDSAPEEPTAQEAAAEEVSAEEQVAEPASSEPVAEKPGVDDAATDAHPAADGEEAEEEPPKREKPAVPGAHLEVDIVPEGVDPLGREDPEDPYAIEEEEDAQTPDEESAEQEYPEPISTAAIDLAAGARYRATGKRKTAIARVTLRPGSGTYVVNGRTLEEHFPRQTLQRNIRQPLETVGYQERMDVVARLQGGGISAQAGALRHGVSRALLEADPNLRGELKRRGFLTRDSRAKERKKAGLKKARKRPQFSKR